MRLSIIDGDVLVYRSIWGTKDLEESKTRFKELLNDVVVSTFSTDYVMAIGGPDNFRVDLFSDYKGNRKKAKDNRPDWFDDLKSWSADSDENTILTDNCEADDMVRVWANQCDEASIDRVVVSIDKDLHCITGPHYNPRTKAIQTITPEYAEKFYWQQVLTGDSTDNIPGIWKCGPVKAKKILAEAETKKDYRKLVCKAYNEAYGEEGYNHLIANGRLIHIWRKDNDHFKIKKEVYEAAIQE